MGIILELITTCIVVHKHIRYSKHMKHLYIPILCLNLQNKLGSNTSDNIAKRL